MSSQIVSSTKSDELPGQSQETMQTHLSVFGIATKWYIDMMCPHFHVCRGERPNGHFTQDEAGEVRELVLNDVVNTIESEIDQDEIGFSNLGNY